MSKRGFSLAELMLTVSLLLVLSVLASLAFKQAPRKADSQSMAFRLEEALKLAQQRARARGFPVALGLPSRGNRVPHSRSYYFAEGDQRASVAEVYDLKKEFPDGYFVAGHWPLMSGSYVRGTTPLLGVKGADFNLGNWLPAGRTNDAFYCFLPSGQVLSNQPSVDGAFHIVVSQGVAYAPAPVVGRNSFQLTSVCGATTLRLSRLGEMSLIDGLPNVALGTVTMAASPPVPAQAFAAPPTLAAIGNNPPNIEGVEIHPKPNGATLPPGVDATVDVKGYLTMVVEATDAESDNLVCRWQASGGGVSASAATAMIWDPVDRRYRSTWEWAPPRGAVAGNRYTVSCRIEDGRGGVDTGFFGATGRIEATETPKIVFNNGGQPATCNTDGTWVVNEDWQAPNGISGIRVSPDGSKVIFVSDGDLWIRDRDASRYSKNRRLSEGPTGQAVTACWSPNGTQVAYVSWDTSAQNFYQLWLVNSDGSKPDDYTVQGRKLLGNNIQPYTPGGACKSGVDFHPSGRGVLVSKADWPLGGQFSWFPIDGSAPTHLSALGPLGWYYCNEVRFSPDGNYLAFERHDFWRNQSGVLSDIVVSNFTLAGNVPTISDPIWNPTNPGWGYQNCYEYSPSWTPDSQQVLFHNWWGMSKVNRDGSGSEEKLTNQPGNVGEGQANWAVR